MTMTNKKGFTLIELLTVIAIMGILATLGMGGYKVIMPRVRQMQSKVQFQEYIQAIQRFKSEYGTYPDFVKGVDDYSFELNTTVTADEFIRTLSGKNPRNGRKQAFGGNYKALSFYDFKDKEMDPETKKIVDAFGNPNITIVVDANNDGIIKRNKVPGASRDIRATVIIYTDPKENSDWEKVSTWEE